MHFAEQFSHAAIYRAVIGGKFLPKSDTYKIKIYFKCIKNGICESVLKSQSIIAQHIVEICILYDESLIKWYCILFFLSGDVNCVVSIMQQRENDIVISCVQPRRGTV